MKVHKNILLFYGIKEKCSVEVHSCICDIAGMHRYSWPEGLNVSLMCDAFMEKECQFTQA